MFFVIGLLIIVGCVTWFWYLLPAEGRVRFYLRTFSGTLTAEAAEQDLGEDRHTLSPLFYAGHQVITAMRQVSERT